MPVTATFHSNQTLRDEDVLALQKIANRARAHVIQMVHRAGTGHIGGPLSVMDILAMLYFRVAHVRPDDAVWPDRDRIVLSKGHAGIGLYAMMALRGYFDEEELATFDAANSRLQAHPDMTALPGLDMSTGSLGQGLSTGIGMALAARKLGKSFHTFVVLGDGETQEGQIWEALDVASKYRLDNVTAVLDWNGLQQFGWGTGDERVAPAGNAHERAAAFGWHIILCNGHDFRSLDDAFVQARTVKGKPTLIAARTVKGKGVPFMEGRHVWHAKVPTDDELQSAIAALEEVSQ